MPADGLKEEVPADVSVDHENVGGDEVDNSKPSRTEQRNKGDERRHKKKKGTKQVKKEEFSQDGDGERSRKRNVLMSVMEECNEETLGSLLRDKAPAKSRPKDPNVKKPKPEVDEDDFPKPVTKNKTPKAEKQVKKLYKEEKMMDAIQQPEQNGKKREKKIYDLPGQKRDTPVERDPLRLFYESLHKQIPSSEMAEIWLMEYGLLPRVVAEKVYQKKQLNKSLQHKMGSPLKAVPDTVKRCTNSVLVKRKTSTPVNVKNVDNLPGDASKQSKKRRVFSDDESDDFVLSSKVKKQKVV